MHRHHRARGKVLFEVLCALSLAASFAGAWDQTGSLALLASASIMALFAFYWSFGLVARDRSDDAAQPTAIVADAQETEVEIPMQEEVIASTLQVLAEPELVAAGPKKQRARKAKKAAVVVAPVVEAPEPVAIEQSISNGPPLEQLFDPQPYVRQPRLAFGRKARGPRPRPAA
jgi:hypothetical protein